MYYLLLYYYIYLFTVLTYYTYPKLFKNKNKY